jgi:hypothetical protein
LLNPDVATAQYPVGGFRCVQFACHGYRYDAADGCSGHLFDFGISDRIALNVKTIETHQMRMKEKFAPHSAAKLRQKAREWLATRGGGGIPPAGAIANVNCLDLTPSPFPSFIPQTASCSAGSPGECPKVTTALRFRYCAR